MALNLWIVWHFFAICTAPASIPPSTELARSAWRKCSGYLQLLYLNHGYHFFAPQPGGSTLLSYEVTRADGSVHWDRRPNREYWPRLRYHRHFLLTEHMAAMFQARPDLKPLIVETYAAEVARQNEGASVVVSHVQHELSTPDQYRSGRPLDDPITYNELWLGEFRWKQP
ncbi:MAG: hypothetical protein R3C05_11215 [Pirellulaceae bacterium]